MTDHQFQQFLTYLRRQAYIIWAPVQADQEVLIKQVEDPRKVQILSQPPLYSFKEFLFPQKEVIFDYKNGKLISRKVALPKQVIFGLTTIDLKALVLLNHIFEKDPYYQARMKNTLIMGQSCLPSDVDCNIFNERYEEDILEHLQFDIFWEKQKQGFQVFTGSEEGQIILDNFGYTGYGHIQFAGPIKEEGLDPLMVKYRERMKHHHKSKIWQDLSRRCIECGKCTIVCPTCFCFRLCDKAGLRENQGRRTRIWDTCFYHEFSEVAGAAKFLKTTAERIHFWYYHKFVRIPDELSIPGCVGCGRCRKVCPVGIDIREVLSQI